ncbi:MAG TPA: hypothetical protein VGR11_14760 [Solirubrobacteraceae bacterium]|nr:hypothetical protein [Solirubrobacteraceae bacterium]
MRRNMNIKSARLNAAGAAVHPQTARYVIRSITTLPAAGAGAFVVARGGDDEKPPAAAKPAAFAITATAEGNSKALEFPATVKSGLVTMTLTNSDKVPRSAGIVRLLGDRSVDDFLKGRHAPKVLHVAAGLESSQTRTRAGAGIALPVSCVRLTSSGP